MYKLNWSEIQKEKKQKEREARAKRCCEVVGYWALIITGAIIIDVILWAIYVVIV